jgi:hypothetical protein
MVGLEQRPVVRAHVVLAHIGHQHASAELPRQFNDDGWNLQIASDVDGVQRPGATHRHEREIARVVTALHRDAAHRERHFRHGNPDDAERHLDGVHLQRPAELRFEPAAGRSDIERHLPTEEALGADAPEHDVGVGDSRMPAAAPITDRPRIRARAVRPELQCTDFVDPSDAAAARTDLDDVDDGEHHGMTARIAADVVALRDRHLAVFDEARRGRSAAQVERDHVRCKPHTIARPRSHRRPARTPS